MPYVVSYQRMKTMEYLKPFNIPKLGRGRLLTRGGRLQKAPKENIGERWSHIAVRLYLRLLFE